MNNQELAGTTSRWGVWSTGFALFSMFFGSGNLVFPIAVGLQSGGDTALAALGILLTGVLVPFLGVWGMMLYQGKLSQFFSFLGPKGLFCFSLLVLSLMGPFGVLARCLTVAHGALLLLIPGLPLPMTSLGLSVLIYLLAVNKNRIVTLLGAYLTPLLLLSLAAIAGIGLVYGAAEPVQTLAHGNPFLNGLLQGYQTCDLLAAFFFSQFVINDLRRKNVTNLTQHFYQSAWIGAALLSTVYVALVLLGWRYASLLAHVPPQEMLGTIALVALGPIAAPCVCVAILFACLTTAIVLASLYADFIHTEVSREKINPRLSMGITLGIAFVVSTFDFNGIARFLGPVLETLYPVLIALTLFNILRFLINHGPTSFDAKSHKK